MDDISVITISHILKQLNDRREPWAELEFVFKKDGLFSSLGTGGFSDVVLMRDRESKNGPAREYAAKIIGFQTTICSEDIKKLTEEPTLQQTLHERCPAIVGIQESIFLSLRLSDNGTIEDLRKTDAADPASGSGEWLILQIIRMERLVPIIYRKLSHKRFLIEELCDGNIDGIMSLAIDIAGALAVSHSEGIMHRDVKLENIFFDSKSSSYKLGDFGVARRTVNDSASTKGAGTSGYEAPEVSGDIGGARYGYKADIYSFGVTLYLLLNDLIFPGTTSIYHVPIDHRMTPDTRIDPPKYGGEALAALVLRMISFHPDDRPSDMNEILSELVAIKGDTLPEPLFEMADVSSEYKTLPEAEAAAETAPLASAPEFPGYAGDGPDGSTDGPKELFDLSNNPAAPKHASLKRAVFSVYAKQTAGTLLLMLGFAGFELMFPGKFTVQYSTAQWIISGLLGAAAIASTVIKYPHKKCCTEAYTSHYYGHLNRLPYGVSFLMIGLLVALMVIKGPDAILILSAVMLLFYAEECLFAICANILLLPFFSGLPESISKAPIFDIKNAWLFFALALAGFSMMFCNFDRKTKDSSLRQVMITFSPFLLLIAGVMIWILNKIPFISVPDILMKMHFIYIGLAGIIAFTIASIVFSDLFAE